MLRLAFDFIITWRETRTRPNAYVVGVETGTSFTKVASGVSAHNLSALATIGYKF